jgi:primosomal protein N' (replication factor Y)
LLKPGLIIVDEEHDAAYVQQDGFRYSARDVAIKRAQLEQCPVVLGSATPSLESWHNAELGRFQRHSLTQRAGTGTLPTLRQIDISGP